MNLDIKQRIEQIKNGEVPEGYTNKYHIKPDSWKDEPLNMFFYKVKDKNHEKRYNTVFTNSAANGVIPQNEYFEKDIANEENIGGYYIVNVEDYIYNPRISEKAPYGPINQNQTGYTGIASPLYTVFAKKENICVCDEYIRYYLSSTEWNKYIYSVANYGARFDRMNISDNDFMNMPIALPLIEEQQKIAEILMQCDKVIELKQKRIEEEKKLKKALMQKLLNPDSGIRLPGFKGEWKKTCIGDITELYSGGTPKSSEMENYADESGIPFIRSGEISATYTELFLSEIGYKNSSAKMVKKGDLLYALYGANSGDCFISKMNGAINQAILCIKSKSEDIRYIYYVLSNSREKITSVYLQGGQGNLSATIIKKIKIDLPSLEEQTAIVSALSSMDTIIENLEKELEQWQQKKKSLMQLLLTGIVRCKV